jgi:hypothetical protein
MVVYSVPNDGRHWLIPWIDSNDDLDFLSLLILQPACLQRRIIDCLIFYNVLYTTLLLHELSAHTHTRIDTMSQVLGPKSYGR